MKGEKSLQKCQAVLRKAKKDMLSIYGRMLEGDHVASEEKTMFRYYCEAIMILAHFQRPGAVEGLTVSGLDLSFCGGISLNRLYYVVCKEDVYVSYSLCEFFFFFRQQSGTQGKILGEKCVWLSANTRLRQCRSPCLP